MGLRVNLANSSLPARVRQLNANEQRQGRLQLPDLLERPQAAHEARKRDGFSRRL